MKVNVEIIGREREESATLAVHQVTEELESIINKLEKNNEEITGQLEGVTYRISLGEIYYIEGVEHRTFVYTKDKVYEIKEKLYQLEEKYHKVDFMRISKSVIVNIDKIVSIAAVINSRFELKLENSEKVLVSRSYIKELKRRLQI
ncbi:DNA-binding LytR/AlgR family response regulator [Lachnospiraceae bacterium PM6-15]|uniref:LytTR family transcriptional regulator DNA-binding domain-containing protein n=1 Tax=Ohessyouella blattaphilus TaxID=2949333 RepID=A0ABT1EI96_9FIRM|nr:LytTR family DNA-binding domain-containing protein [Ohessyouella blattaphilus]MCP1110429.1 LytTR family transcriptional regulator DNA-binding domain-containing protein [Ohessyouella blattaphilus]MCR8563823.1 LytTR family transcriptional regulator DNA-binding domain-containing protein [Ohessyouella blattaphilus]